MNPNFCFPKRRPAPSRRLPADPSIVPAQVSRDSSALRASVLDAALLLGVGTNSIVTNWMFNNTLEEEETEGEITSSPGLTSGSTATSEESLISSPSPFFTTDTYPNLSPIMESHPKTAPYSNFPDPIASPVEEPPVSSQSATVVPFEHTPKRDKQPRKLKKRRGDGYESDGGLISDPHKKEKDKDRKKRDAKTSRKRFEDRGYDTDVGRFAEAYYPSVKTNPQRPSKTKQKPSDDRPPVIETDDGNLSPSKTKKSRSFFRLPSKSSKPDLKQTEKQSIDIPPMPFLPPRPLPIAEMFASREGSPITPASPSAGLAETGLGTATSNLTASTVTPLIPGKSTEDGSKSSRRVGVLFTPKLQDLSDSGSSSENHTATSTSENVGARPTISLPLTRPLSPRRRVPYPLAIAPTISVPRNRSPSPSSTIIPSSDYLVPSPGPSVLGYYDLPPPSPPPSGPLPPPPVPREPSRGRSPLSALNNSPRNLEPGLFTRPLRTASPQSRSTPLRNPLMRLPTSPSQGRPPSFPARPSNISSPLPTRKPSLPLIQRNDSSERSITPVSRAPSIRGRESPFPTRPLVAPMVLSSFSQHRHSGRVSPEDVDGILHVKRYRDLYHADSAGEHNLSVPHSDSTRSRVWTPRELHGEEGDEASVHDDNEMRDVLGRFTEFGGDGQAQNVVEQVGDMPRGSVIEDDPLGRNSYMGYSFDRDDDDVDDDKSQYPDEENTAGRGMASLIKNSTVKMAEAVDSLDLEDLDPDARLSRYSALLYNRTSILDGERSMEARARFVSRIEAMFDKSGREKGVDVPSVPRLPVGLGKGGSYVGRF